MLPRATGTVVELSYLYVRIVITLFVPCGASKGARFGHHGGGCGKLEAGGAEDSRPHRGEWGRGRGDAGGSFQGDSSWLIG